MSMALVKSCGNCLAVHRAMAFVINSSSATRAVCLLFAVASRLLCCSFRCEVNHASSGMCHRYMEDGGKREAVTLFFLYFVLHFFLIADIRNFLKCWHLFSHFYFFYPVFLFFFKCGHCCVFIYLFWQLERTELWWVSILAGQQSPQGDRPRNYPMIHV